MDDKLHQYIESLINERPPLFTEMEAFAKEAHVPIMEIVGMEALLQMLRVQQPKKILEIGTAIGYSALRMAEALPGVQIVSIERDQERYEQACKFIEKSGCSDQIHLVFGDALETVGQAGELGPFDALFIDAAKGQYTKFFEKYSPFVSDMGAIYTDNVLFKGLVADTEIEVKRIRNLAKKIHHYNEWLMNHEEYHTAILPVGDGLAISTKRGGSK
ncbi:putative O-methyltransferase YrrM [Bacillus ectoiniformans]|uniref:O-methyltransferase n=1 Tax=Bacillus ectoiniformans TaxID=1494429 RepID=UPI0019595830|nr:O-methyltransferase [Bacillus ectoiniformans]MBM7649026.1 putative O-methyltransferase YrrM [Bacillus ectoiniformans]